MAAEFKKKYSLEKRLEESTKIKEKHTDRLPIIVTKGDTANISNIEKSKFLAPRDLTLGQFLHVIRKRIKLNENEALFLFINGSILPNNSDSIENTYNTYKDEDGFLYITYCNENVFGN